MTHLTRGALALSALIALAACDADPDTSLTSLDSRAATSASVDADQPVFTFAGNVEVGSSRLVRRSGGVSYQLSTSGLQSGHAYTLWIVVFNEPSKCGAPTPISACGGPDVVNPDAMPDMAYAAGSIVGSSGRATFAGSNRIGALAGSINAPVLPPELASGLRSPRGAEIHLVLHDHGPVLPEYLPDMTKSVDGGCTDAGIPAAGVSSPWNDYDGPAEGAYGRRGPNTCLDVQFAVHTP